MSVVINYYEELNITKDFGIEEINRELNRLESIWKRRKMTNPEKAVKLLALVADARGVFKSKASREKYDMSLMYREEQSESDGNADKREEAARFLLEAENYFSDGQFDLAKIMIDKALALAEYSSNQGRLYAMAESVYLKNGFCKEAVEYANQAIALLPNNLELYKNKEICLHALISFRLRKKQNACKYIPKNYDLTEQYAREALQYNGNNEEAKSILQRIDQPKEVDEGELKRYWKEKSPYENEIMALVDEIIAQGSKSQNKTEWIMTSKRFIGHYNPNKDGMDEEQFMETKFVLDISGTFAKKVTWTTEYWRPGFLPFKNNEEYTKECDLSELMAEMDFDAHSYWTNYKGWSEDSYFVSSIRVSPQRITRKYRKKGQALYNRLKEILNFDAIYKSELAKVKEEINEKYGKKRKNILSEMNVKINEIAAKEISIKKNIASMESEYSSLGLLNWRRKKELERHILDEKQELLQLSPKEVKVTYQKKLHDMDMEADNEMARTENELRKKYIF